MNRLKNRIGMTLAEMLIVVGIIVVLTGVAFVAVSSYLRSLGQVERDGVAKEIFFAAQNHLTAAYGEGYLGVTEFGSQGTHADDKDADGKNKEIYYFVVNGNISDSSVLGQMLPFGSIDETVRTGGSYIVRYQKDTGLVLDVFYCTRSGWPGRFNRTLGDEYGTVMGLRGKEKKNNRQNYEGAILGWYGGTDADDVSKVTLKAPTIKIVNAEKLYVVISDPNSSIAKAKMKLIITGVDSKAKKAYELKLAATDTRVKYYDNVYTVILDDLTVSDMHFANIASDTADAFIPGENIEIQAVAYNNEELSNIAYSQKGTTNSLFESINAAQDTAYVGNIRHLENLDKKISNLADPSGKVKISAAEQTDSFSWIDFEKNNKKIETKATSGTESDAGYDSVHIYPISGSSTPAGSYMPISPSYSLTYDGKNHSISDVDVKASAYAGLFGQTSNVSKISNLELIDFKIIGQNSAGALGGELTGCAVSNVLARNSDAAAEVNITAATAGGLIGKTTGCDVQYSAAALIVGGSGSTTAGGLIGNAQSGTIANCYSGGHTKEGSYEEWVTENSRFDVTGTTAGGLIGSSGATISNSYSTCSVSGTTAGGFAGSATGSISNCYSTGLMDKETGGTAVYAFLGSGGANLSGNFYYSGVNMVPKEAAEGETVIEGEMEMMKPVSGYSTETGLSRLKPLDLNADTYNEYVDAYDEWDPCMPYDTTLVMYYSAKYPLKGITRLSGTEPSSSDVTYYTAMHYGDWPSPEVFFLN